MADLRFTLRTWAPSRGVAFGLVSQLRSFGPTETPWASEQKAPRLEPLIDPRTGEEGDVDRSSPLLGPLLSAGGTRGSGPHG